MNMVTSAFRLLYFARLMPTHPDEYNLARDLEQRAVQISASSIL